MTDRPQPGPNTRNKKKHLVTVFAVCFSYAFLALTVKAQTTTLRNPLIPGAPSTAPFVPASPGQPPPPGDGMIPDPVTPGMPGGPPLLPWVPAIPANQIDRDSSRVNLGVDNSVEAPPGVLGKSLTVPPPPSTPGTDPGMLPGPIGFKKPPAAIVQINPQGGMPGDSAPKKRWGAQTTGDFGLYRPARFGNDKRVGSQLTDFGQPLNKVAVKAPRSSQDGPRSAQYPGERNREKNYVHSDNKPENQGQPTTDLYGNRMTIPGKPRALMTIAPY